MILLPSFTAINKKSNYEFGAGSGGSGNTYYVSTTGDNGDNGTHITTPWQTIKYAATKAKAGDTVYIKQGNYRNEEVVIKNSGTRGNPITFEGSDSAPGDKPEGN